LVEMLAVVLIMAILLTGGAVGIKNLSVGKGSSVGIATGEAMLLEARSIAISKGARARLCITNERSTKRGAEDIFRSRMYVAYDFDDPNISGTDPNWVVDNRPVFLPKGTFFSQEFSQKDHSPSGSGDIYTESSFSPRYIKIDPDAEPGDDITYREASDLRGNVLCYEFNSEGILVDPSDGESALVGGSSFVVGTGARDPRSNDDPVLLGNKDLDGIIIWKKGETSRLRDINQITSTEDPTSF